MSQHYPGQQVDQRLVSNSGSYPSPLVLPISHVSFAGINAMLPWYHRRVVRIALVTAAVAVITISAVAMLIVLGANLGFGVFTLAAGVAVLPVPFLILALMWLDRYEPEPLHYLAFAFCWGAFVATAVALTINSAGIAAFAGPDSQSAARNTAIFVAPPAEEIAKALPLFIFVILVALGRRPIHGVIDGIVYAGMSAVGFAFVENILYFGQAYLKGEEDANGSGGLLALAGTFIMRAVVSPFAHPLFTCMVGIGVGLAVRNRGKFVRIAAPLMGLALAIALHAFWNTLATSGSLLWLGLGYLLVMLPLFIALVSMAVWMRSQEAKLAGRFLPPYVAAGWLTQNELESMSTLGGRRAARNWARAVGGSTAGKAMQEFQLAAAHLALLREAMNNGAPTVNDQEQEHQLLTIMASRRQLFAEAAAAAAQRWSQYGAYYSPNWYRY